MRRPLLALLACAAVLHAEVATLLRRAEARIAHGNVDGARALFEQAAAEDPACPQALERLATLDTEGGAASRLRYLRDAREVDPEAAARFLIELRERVVDLPEEAYLEAERAAMQPIDPLPRLAGPCRPWERLAPQAVSPPMPGPLRGEALGTPAHDHRDALRLVAKRLPRETPVFAVAWARLAALLRLLGDDEAAEAALSAARPATLDDRIEVAESALVASGDPLAWWRANGEALVAECAAERSDGRLPAIEAVCRRARDVLAGAGDLRALVSLARLQAEVSQPGILYKILDETAARICDERLPDEAHHALEGANDAASACVKACLLFTMLQDDLGLATMEKAAERAPDDLLVQDALAHAFDRFGSVAARNRTVARLAEMARSAGRGFADPRRNDTKPGPSLLDGLLAEGRWEDVPARVDHLSPDDAGACGLALREDVRKGNRFRGMEALLAAFAKPPRWSHPQERFVRAFVRGGNPSEDYPIAFLRLWQEASADAALRAAPSGLYVLSLLRDPRTQGEECASLRRAAFAAGCRCTGLLVDMSRDGQEVPEALAEADPVAMRLERALVGDNASLERFLEEDEAWPEQLLTAREEGCRRRGLGMPAPKTRRSPWETPLARLVYRFQCAQDIPPGWVARRVAAALDDPYPHAMDDVLLLDRVHPSTAGEAISRGRWWGGNARVGGPRQAPEPPIPPVEELLRLAPVGRTWSTAVQRVLADGGDAALRLAREMAARHPLDLRWVDAEQTQGGWKSSHDARSRWEIEEVLLPARQRNPAALREHMSNSEGKGRAAGLVDRYASMVGDDPPSELARWLGPVSDSEDLRDEVRRLLEGCFARASSDEDLYWISRRADDCRLPDLAARIDARLLAESGGAGFLDAYQRARARGAVSRDPERTREMALRPGAGATWGWRLWPWVAQDAVAAGRVDLLLEALETIWREHPALLDPYREGDSEDLKQLVKDDACLDLVKPLFKNGEAPLSAWCLAAASLSWSFREWVRDLQPWAKMEKAGMPRGMRDVFPSGPVPVGDIASRVRGLLRIDWAPSTEDRSIWLAQHLANRFEWDRRDEEFFACVGAWAEWKGKQVVGPDEELYLEMALGFSTPHYMDLGTPLEPWALPTGVNEARAVHYLPLFGPMLERLERAAMSVEEPVARTTIFVSIASRALLAEIPDRAVRPLILALRDSPVPAVREYAYRKLCDLYDRCPEAHDAFVERLLDECADMAPPDAETLRTWEARLAADELGARERATEALLATDRLAVPIARGLLSSSDAEVRCRAEEILMQLAAP